MPVLFQINVTANWGSHGRIAEEIGEMAMAQGWDSYIAYGRYANPSKSHLLKVGSPFGHYLHGLQSMLFDRHGLGSTSATWKLIREIEWIRPWILSELSDLVPVSVRNEYSCGVDATRLLADHRALCVLYICGL